MQLKANSSEASQKMPLIMGFVCPHKTKDGNVMSFIIQRLEANGELSTKLRMRVKIWLKYVKTVILRRTTSSHATLCSIMQLGADKEAAIVIQILNSIAHFCLVAFKPL